MSDYDFIVAGAGPGGCVAARRAAERGLKVLLLDAKRRDDVGHPWVDDVEEGVFKRLGLAYPQDKERWPAPEHYRLESPSGRHRMEVGLLPFVGLRMSRYCSRLLADAGKAGAEFREGVRVDGPLLDGQGSVRGVITAGKEIPARLVLDATGLQAAVRRGLPDTSPVQRELDESCLVTAWREQRYFTEDEAPDIPQALGIPPDHAVSRVGWRGGYSVILQHFGTYGRVLDILVGFNLKAGGGNAGESAGEYVRRYLKERGVGGEIFYGGGGLIPVRRSLDVLVDDGLMLAGDAACMVIPAHGSGVASAMVAGDLAATVAAKCLKRGDVSRQALWEYCASWQRGRGAVMAYFDFVRLLSERLGEEDMEKLVGYAMTPLDMEIAVEARPLPIRPGNLLKRAKGFRYPLFLARYANLARYSISMKKAYERYPTRFGRRELEAWRGEVDRVIRKLR
jgi:digeranylgeranylglycerophospholipid reductase